MTVVESDGRTPESAPRTLAGDHATEQVRLRPVGGVRRILPASLAEGHRAQASGCAISAAIAASSVTSRNPVDAFAVRLLGFEVEPELPTHHSSKKSAHRVLLPAGTSHDARDGGPARPAQQPQHPRLLGIRPLGLMRKRLLRAGFAYRTPPNGSRRLALGHFKAPLQVPAQSAPPPPKPRGGRAALAGERSEPEGSVSVGQCIAAC